MIPKADIDPCCVLENSVLEFCSPKINNQVLFYFQIYNFYQICKDKVAFSYMVSYNTRVPNNPNNNVKFLTPLSQITTSLASMK